MEKPEYFECRCSTPEHTLRVWFDDDKDDPCVYVSVFLANDSWHRRLWTAIKYALGYKCRYGHFDEFILRPEDCDRLSAVLDRLKKAGSDERP